MFNLFAIRKMIKLFRNYREPTEQPYNWYVNTDKQKRNWNSFVNHLMYKTIFQENWRDTLARYICPNYYNKFRQSERLENINRLIRKAIELGLIRQHKRFLHTTSTSDIEIQLEDAGVHFVKNFTDFLKKMFEEYNKVISFLVGLISSSLLWIITELSDILMQLFFTEH